MKGRLTLQELRIRKINLFEEHKFYINALYVAATRAINSVYIVDDGKKCNLLQVIKPEKEGHENIKKEESSPEEWKDMALKLIDEGNIEQAEKIKEKLLRKGEKKYAEKIVDALKAKEKDHTQESQLPLDKNEQAISELKTENPTPQKSSMGDKASRTLTKTNQKHDGEKHKARQNQNESQEDGIKRLIRTSRHNEAVDKLKMAGVSQYDTQQVLINIICNDKIDELKKIDISQYDKKHILEFSLQKSALKITEFLIKDRGFTPENSNFSVSWLGGDDFALLLQACQYGFFSVAKFLLHYHPDHSKDNILCWAVEEYRYDVARILNDRANAKYSKGTPLHEAAQKGEEGLTLLHQSMVQLILKNGATVNAKNHDGCAALLLALNSGYSRVVEDLLDDQNINVGCIDLKFVSKEKADKRKLVQKKVQDDRLFKRVKEAAEKMKNGGELDESLKEELENLLKPESEHGFKPSLNYSPDGDDKNTTVKIAIEAGGKLLQLLYDYANKNMEDTKIFKWLKDAKEQQKNFQPRSSFNDVTTPHNLAQVQVSTT